MFSDGAPRSFGTGWISGVLAVALGLLCLASILCLHFPHWLTIPDLRGRYPLALVRTAIDLAILAVLILSALSMVLRRRKMLGLAGLGLAALCLLLGAGGVEIPRAQGAGIYVGLDWFVLGVLATATLFVPLERAWALRPGQGPFRRGWLTDFQYFFMSHALVQLMSVLVLALGKTGAWVLAAGAMRYAFVLAAGAWPWLAAPLPPSMRRKTVCVVQIVTLIVCLGPIVTPIAASAIAGAGLAALVYSFGADIFWLARRRRSAVAGC